MRSRRNPCRPEDVLSFWFEELDPKHWFIPPVGLDEQCERRFRDTHLALAEHIGPEWRASPRNRLAAIIVLDQLPRNIYRNTPLAFATDGRALNEAVEAVNTGADLEVPEAWRPFFYMPFEHSEMLEDQTLAVKFFTTLGDASYIDFAIRHREVIRLFGRFPHRNAIMGRRSTPEEEAYLSQPGSGF